MNNMNMDIAVRKWCEIHERTFKIHKIKIIKKLPETGSNEPWKGTLEFNLDHIVGSFTVWERDPIEISVVIFNIKIQKTLLVRERTVNTPEETIILLDEIINNLVGHVYHLMAPDPRLIKA